MYPKIGISLFLLLLGTTFFYPSPSAGQAPSRTVLVEEFTGEWCGWCPIGMMELEEMIAKFGDSIIVVAVHTGDQLESASASEMIAAWANFAPSALINRIYDTILGAQVIDTDNWEEVIARQIDSPPPCNVQLAYSYNESTREIVATVTVIFTEYFIGDGRLNLYIAEDSVMGISQSNYLSGNPDYVNTPYYALPEQIPNFIHQHVLREMVGESYGVDGIIPDTVFAGQQFQYTFNYTIPNDHDLANLHVIGLVQQHKGLKKYRKILNSTHSKFNPAGVGLYEHSPASSLLISPNPATTAVQAKMNNKEMIQRIKIFTISGLQVYQRSAGNGEVLINLDNFCNGCFIMVVETDKNTYRRKFIVNK